MKKSSNENSLGVLTVHENLRKTMKIYKNLCN